MSPAKTLIEELRLSPHPEGGWFRETWRAPEEDGERSSATAIYFLLEAHQRSHWHKVDAAEIWLWHAGDHPHYVIGAHEWQAASALPGTHGYTLVSCVVTPAFQFAGFTLAPPGWRPGKEQDVAAMG